MHLLLVASFATIYFYIVSTSFLLLLVRHLLLEAMHLLLVASFATNFKLFLLASGYY